MKTCIQLTYKCRDIGCGREHGTILGNWFGAVDTWGKRAFVPFAGYTLYLFPDEIVRERKINVLWGAK